MKNYIIYNFIPQIANKENYSLEGFKIFVIIETPSFIVLARERRKANIKVCVHNMQYQKGLYMIHYLWEKIL
jgi:hypothetical protein